MAATPLDNFFQQDSSRLEGEINELQRNTGRLSALMEKGILPDGMGYNFNSVLYQRSTPTGGAGWQDVAVENGSLNNCVPDPSIIAPASALFSYNAQAKLMRSVNICFEDARRGYLFQEQVAAIQDNIVAQVVDEWEDRDKYWYFRTAGHKIINNEALTETTNGTTMPATVPTFKANADVMQTIYTRMVQDGGKKYAYAMLDGAPLFTAIMSMERKYDIIKGNAATREDFRWAEATMGNAATLLKSWNVDRPYGGFLYVLDDRMPRYDFVDGTWVERPYYNSTASTIGQAANVSTAYQNAAYEDIYFWHPKVVERQVPKPLGSVGSGTTGMAVNWNGDVVWRNILSVTENPLGNIGQYWAPLQAAWKPKIPQYGYILRVLRCTNNTGSGCYG